MNENWAAAILGVVEGLTEFLPVSSTGHMILVQPLLGVDESLPRWRVFLFLSQVGAILAVVLYFWRDLWRRVFTPPGPNWSSHILVKLTAAMIPTVILGVAFDDLMEKYLLTPPIVAVGLIAGAGVMVWIDSRYRRTSDMTLDDVTLKQCFLLGAIQAIAMIPGVSRSGATIMGGMVLGLTPRVAAEFSFYLAIPTLSAAAAKQLLDYWGDLNAASVPMLAVGTFTAFVTALLVVWGFMQFVQRYRFTAFAVYRVVLGLVVLVWWYQPA